MLTSFFRRLAQLHLIFSPPPNMRRQHERFEIDVAVNVARHEAQFTRKAVNVSDGGAFLAPSLEGYVGQHIFLSYGQLITDVEARIVSHRPAGTGVEFVSKTHGSLFASWLLRKKNDDSVSGPLSGPQDSPT
mgnify:CR=1 FL=1